MLFLIDFDRGGDVESGIVAHFDISQMASKMDGDNTFFLYRIRMKGSVSTKKISNTVIFGKKI